MNEYYKLWIELVRKEEETKILVINGDEGFEFINLKNRTICRVDFSGLDEEQDDDVKIWADNVMARVKYVLE